MTASSGNHGLGISTITRLLGLPCTVVVPRECPEVKREKINSNGATFIVCKTHEYEEKLRLCQEISDAEGKLYVSSHSNLDLIAGQGTMALELVGQLEGSPPLDAVIAPLNGGGMLAGICTAVKALWPQCKVIAAEPVGKELEKRLRSGKRDWPRPSQYLETKAEGIKGQYGAIVGVLPAQKRHFEVFNSNFKRKRQIFFPNYIARYTQIS